MKYAGRSTVAGRSQCSIIRSTVYLPVKCGTSTYSAPLNTDRYTNAFHAGFASDAQGLQRLREFVGGIGGEQEQAC